jgi:hypothetical protein
LFFQGGGKAFQREEIGKTQDPLENNPAGLAVGNRLQAEVVANADPHLHLVLAGQVAGERLLDNLEDFTPGEAMTDGKRGDDGFHAAPPVKLLKNRPGILVSLLFSGGMTSTDPHLLNCIKPFAKRRWPILYRLRALSLLRLYSKNL